jgi:hypothetical protein
MQEQVSQLGLEADVLAKTDRARIKRYDPILSEPYKLNPTAGAILRLIWARRRDIDTGLVKDLMPTPGTFTMRFVPSLSKNPSHC